MLVFLQKNTALFVFGYQNYFDVLSLLKLGGFIILILCSLIDI